MRSKRSRLDHSLAYVIGRERGKLRLVRDKTPSNGVNLPVTPDTLVVAEHNKCT